MWDEVEQVDEDVEHDEELHSNDEQESIVDDEDKSISLGSNDSDTAIFAEEDAEPVNVSAEEKAELHGRTLHQTQAEVDVEKDYCNEVHAKLNKLIGVLRGGADFSDQLLNAKDLLRLFALSVTDDGDGLAPPAVRRVGERLLLSPSIDVVHKVILPLYGSPHDELIELAILLTQKLSECPHPNFATIYPPHELQQYNMNLRVLKNRLNLNSVLTTWSTYCAKIKDDLARGGMSEELKQKKMQIQARLDKIKANETYEVLTSDLDLELVPGKPTVGSSLKGAIWHTTGQRRLAEISALCKVRKTMISKVLIALKQVILNFLRIASPPDTTSEINSVIPWRGSEQDLEFVRMLFSHNLVDLFQKEQHLLIDEEAYIRDKRKQDRRDEFENYLGSDDSILIRNMEFQYQLIRYVSPLALSVTATKRFMSGINTQSTNTDAPQTSTIKESIHEVRIARFSLDASAALSRQQGKMSNADKPATWCRHGDRQRFTKLIGVVHKETRREQIEFGEFQYGATDVFHLLGENWEDKESARNIENACQIYWQNWSDVALASFCDYINEYTGSALEKFWTAWITDIERQTIDIDVSPSVISRLISILSWTLIYTFGVTAQLLVELKSTAEHCLSAYYKRLEEHVGRLCYWSRLGFQTKTMTFINQKLTRELKKPAKERSHTLLRASTRLMVLQNAWAKLLFDSQHVVKGAEGQQNRVERLKDVGRNLYIHIAKNQSCALIVRLLQNYTTANAELELLLYALLSVDQLDQASRQISSVASKTKKKVFARRGNKFVDMGIDFRVGQENGGANPTPEEESVTNSSIMSLFRPVITSPKTLTKLLFLASKSDLFPLAIKRAVFNLLNNLAATDVGRCVAWDLQRIGLLNAITCSKEPLAQNIQSIIFDSIKLLADCSAKNQFAVVEVLFGSWLIAGEYSLRDIMNNYKLIQETGGASKGGVSAWTVSQTRAMMNAYEKAKYLGGRSVLRQIRLDVDSEDVEDAVRRFNLVDPTYMGDDHSPHMAFDQALADWILKSENSSPQLFEEGQTFTDIIKADCEERFVHLLTKIRPIIARNGGKLDDLCVGMAVTTLLSEIVRWEIDQRFETMDDDNALETDTDRGECQEYLRKVTKHLYGVCNLRKHRINPYTVSPEVIETPAELAESKPQWVRESVKLILLMILCDPKTREPFLLTPLNTLETRTHLASMAVSRPLADLESKVVDIQKNQQALLTIKSAEVIRIFRRSCRFVRELGDLLSDVSNVALKLIGKLEVFCSSKDTSWDSFNLGLHGEEGETEDDGDSFLPTATDHSANPWDTKSQWNLEEIVEGLAIPNLQGMPDTVSTAEKKAEHSLGPLGTSLEYQAWLHCIGGISNALANPTHWEWTTSKITRVKLAKYLLLSRFALQVLKPDNLESLCSVISNCGEEIEIWRALVDPLAAEGIDESLFTDEKINYKLIGGKKKKSAVTKENTAPQQNEGDVATDPPKANDRGSGDQEFPAATLPPQKKKKLLIKRKQAPKFNIPTINSILAIEDGVMSEDEDEEEIDQNKLINECQQKMAQQFEEANKSPVVEKPVYDATLDENAKIQSLIWEDDDYDLFSGALSLLAD